jgi:Xaa-Pro aminopeptidase
MNPTNERIAALREAMLANGCEAYLIPTGDPHSSEYLPTHYNAREYFSGFTGENSNLVVTRTGSALWADGRFFVQAENQLAGTEIELMRMAEPGVPTVEEYCANALGEGQALGLCGLTASCGLVRSLQKALDKKGATIRTLDLEDELWVEGRPALPATPAWLLGKEYAGFSPAEKLGQLREKLAEKQCTAQLCGKLDNLAWLLNLRAMDINCTPYAMAYCYVTMDRAVLFINTARLAPEAAAELAENGVTIREYDEVLAFLAAETKAETVLADPASVNYAVYQTLAANPALTVKDEADPLLMLKGVKNATELAHTREAHIRDGVAMVRFQIELEQRLAAGETLYETDIDDMLHKYRSAQDKFLVESFGTIAAYGPNAAMMHYHASRENPTEIQRKGFLLVDCGGTYLDGTTDITRTYAVGPLTEDERLFYTWTLQCHIDLAKSVWLNYCTGQMLDTIAREPLWQHLINYRCGTGHSVSFVGNVHEGPHALNGRNQVVFVPGMVITDEPGVYEGGQVGIRIENELECVDVAENQYGKFLGFRPLMFVPIDTTPIVPGVLTRDEIDWLNDYHRQVFEKLAPRLDETERDWLAKKCAAIGK